MEGMQIKQTIAMLMAAESQGATHVMLAYKDNLKMPCCAPVDWVSPAPVDGVVYMSALGQAEYMSNEAAESIDW